MALAQSTNNALLLTSVVLFALLLGVDAAPKRKYGPKEARGYGRSNTSTRTDEETITRTVTDEETGSLSKSFPYTRTQNISHVDPIYANITTSVAWTLAYQATLQTAIRLAVQAKYNHPISVSWLRIKKNGNTGTIGTFTFARLNIRLVTYTMYMRALVEDFNKPTATSILKTQASVTSLRIAKLSDPIIRIDLAKTSTLITGSLAMNRPGWLYYAVILQTGSSPRTPTAPTAAQLISTAYATLSTNTNQGNLQIFGRKICVFAVGSAKEACTFNNVFSFVPLSGRIYDVYYTQISDIGLGLIPGKNVTSPVYQKALTTDFIASGISGSKFTCDKSVMTYGCPTSDAACVTATSTMQTTCAITVLNSAGVAERACVAGTACLGITSHPGHFLVEVLRDNAASIASYTVKVGTVLGAQTNGGVAAADGTTTTISFTINAPDINYGGNGLIKIKVKQLDTGAYIYMTTGSSVSEKQILLRDIRPDSNSELTCVGSEGSSTFDKGRVLTMPAALAQLSQNFITTGVPSSQLCTGNCASSVTCTIKPKQLTVFGRGLLTDFAPYVDAVPGAVGKGVTLSALKGGSNNCDCSAFTTATMDQCMCSDTTYTFKIIATADVLRVPNIQRVQVNINGALERNMQQDFSLNYGQVTTSNVIDISCNTTGSSGPNMVLANRPFTCFLGVRDANNKAYPLLPSCLRVSSANVTHFPALAPPTVSSVSSEGVFFQFTSATGDYGKCTGLSNTICPFTITLGETCGVTAGVAITQSVMQEHGIPTNESSVSCGLQSGLSSIRFGSGASSTVICTVSPRDAFGPITCCRGVAQPYVFTSDSGTMSTPAISADAKTVTSILTPPSTIPLGGNITVSTSVNGVAIKPAILFFVDYPTPDSTLSCASNSTVSLQTVTCTITVFNGAKASFADPDDFYALITRNANAATISNIRVAVTSPKREILFDLTANAIATTLDVSVFSRFYAGNRTRGSNDVSLNSSLQLKGAPITFTISYGTPTTASILTCVSTTINAMQSISCSIAVMGATGKTAVNPASPPFTVITGANFSVSPFQSTDGSVVNFMVTATGGANIGDMTTISVTIGGANITNIVSVTVIGAPTAANTTMMCNDAVSLSGVRPGQNLSCVILPGNNVGRTKALASILEATSTATTQPSPLVSVDGGGRYTFTWMAPIDARQATTFSLKLNVASVPGAVVTINVSPSDPSNVTSTVSCKPWNAKVANGNVEIGRAALCSVFLKDPAGVEIFSTLTTELTATSANGIATPFFVSDSLPRMYQFNFTSNTDVPVTAIVVVNLRSIIVATASINVIYGTPTTADSTVTCPAVNLSTTMDCIITAKDEIGFTTSAVGTFAAAATGGGCLVTNVTRSPKGDLVTVTIAATVGGTKVCVLAGSRSGAALPLNVTLNVNVAPPVPVIVTFPTITLSFPGSRTSDGSGLYTTADTITVVASHDAVAGTVTYTWSRVDSNVSTILTTTSNVPSFDLTTISRLTTSAPLTLISVTATANGYTTAMASGRIVIESPPTGGALTSNVNSIVALKDVVFTCSGWTCGGSCATLAQEKRFTMIFLRGTKVMGSSATDKLTITMPYESGSAPVSYTFSCVAVANSNGLKSAASAAVTVSVTPVAITSATVTSLITNVANLSTTVPPTDAERSKFSNDVNTAASALKGLTTGNNDAAATSLVNSLTAGVGALSASGLSEAEKDVYSDVVNQAVSKITGPVTSAFTNNVLQVMSASAKIPLSNAAAKSLFGAVDGLIALLSKPVAPTKKKFQSLAVSANTRNIGLAYKSAFDAARSYLLSPGNALGTKWSTSGTAFVLDSVIDVESAIPNHYTNQRARPSKTSSTILASVHFTFTPAPFTTATQVQLYGYSLGNAAGLVPSEVAVSVAGLGVNLVVQSYDMNADTYVPCTMAGTSATCAPRASSLAPIYYGVYRGPVVTTPAPVTQILTPAPLIIASTPAPQAAKSNTAMIVGIVVGVGGALILGGIAAFCFFKKRDEGITNANQSAVANPSGQQPNGPESFQQQGNVNSRGGPQGQEMTHQV